MVPFASAANLATRWRHLYEFQIWPQDGATCICCNFDHQMAPLASVAILASMWCRLHRSKIRPPSGTTCIRSKFGHQVAPLAWDPKLAIRWRHLQILQIWPPGCITRIVTLPWIALVALLVSIELVSSLARSADSTQLSFKKV